MIPMPRFTGYWATRGNHGRLHKTYIYTTLKSPWAFKLDILLMDKILHYPL